MANELMTFCDFEGNVIETREMTDEQQAAIDKARAQARERISWWRENEPKYDTHEELVDAFKKAFGVM